MLKHHIEQGIVVLEPVSALFAEDFQGLTAEVDAYLSTHPTVRGVLVHAPNFPGWDSFAAMTAHIRFVRDHHSQVERIALVTDSALVTVAEAFAKHFLAATIKHFAYSEMELAKSWLNGEELFDAPLHYAPYAGRRPV